MKKYMWWVGGIAAIIMLYVGFSYFGLLEKGRIDIGETVFIKQNQTSTSTEISKEVKYTIEPVVQNVFVPWSIVFTDNNRMLFSERKGTMRVVQDGTLSEKPLHTFSQVSTRSEEGLMGLALDPNYKENKFIYACYAYAKGNELVDKVVRLRDNGDSLSEETTIIDNIPAAQYHAGCRIAFGPDKKLYITTGEATDKNIAQDLSSLGGKILRINSDGSIPEDNPFKDSAVYSYGHRNPQGITWSADGKVLISNEHGPSIFDGPAGGDEINNIIAGANYGWPILSHDKKKEGYVSPLIQFTPAVAPGSALIYAGNIFPQWKGTLLFGGLKGEGVYVVSFTDNTYSDVSSYEKLNINVGRVREVVQGPDGYIYFSTSNRDGRGSVRGNDDKIYRIVPE